MSDLVLDLRKAVPGEEFDYLLLMDQLAGFRNPRAKVSDLLRKGWIVRVKKGLYVFGPRLARRPFSALVLAGLVYGPSCVSLQTALAHHGLIPEAVPQILGVTPLRNKRFETPVGGFRYRFLNPARYPVGVTLERLSDGTPFTIATPEKALADWLVLQPGHPPLSGPGDLADYLAADLRLEPTTWRQLDARRIRQLAAAYAHPRVDLLTALVKPRGGKA
jgi:hypothetical protein